ncbi:MAG: hypothetical protein ACRD9W_02550 [Terriglobia bacterium]
MTVPFQFSALAGRIVPAGTGLPLVPGGVPIAPPVQKPNTLELPPYLFPPFTSTAFNLADASAITGVGVIINPAALQLKIPNNCYGSINQIDLLLNGIVSTSNVKWRLTINTVPVPGWNNLTILPRSGAASVNRGWGPQLGIRVPLGGVIGIQIQDFDGAAYTVGTQIYGWFWPQER